METLTTLLDLASGIQATAPAFHRMHLSFDRCAIRVQSNSLELVDDLNRYYRPFTRGPAEPDIKIVALETSQVRPDIPFRDKQPDPGKSLVKEEYCDLEGGRVVRKKPTGMLFCFGGGLNLAAGLCRKNLNQVVNFINSRYVQWMLERGSLLLHASGVARERGGLAIAGRAGTGKSTLALHLMNLGTNFVSNDRVLVRREEEGLDMYGLAKLPRINPGTAISNPRLREIIPPAQREELEQLAADDLWKLESKYDVNVLDLFGRDRLCPGPVSMLGLVVLQWSRGKGEPRFLHTKLGDRPETLAVCMKSPGLFFQPPPGTGAPDFSEEAYLRLLKDCPLLLVEGGVDFHVAASRCHRFLEEREGERI
jgi:HprK-related kinase B